MNIPILTLAVILSAGGAATALAEEIETERVIVERSERAGESGEPGDGPRRRPGREGRPDGEGRFGREGRGRPPLDPEMKEKHEAYREAQEKVRELARGGKSADKAAVRKAVAELFDAKLAVDSAMLSQMEKRAAQMREKLAKRKASRERLIDEKAARVLGESDDDWD